MDSHVQSDRATDRPIKVYETSRRRLRSFSVILVVHDVSVETAMHSRIVMYNISVVLATLDTKRLPTKYLRSFIINDHPINSCLISSLEKCLFFIFIILHLFCFSHSTNLIHVIISFQTPIPTGNQNPSRVQCARN